MTTNDQFKHIQQMEKNLNQITQFLGEAKNLLSRWKEIQPQIKELERYYQSPEWLKDHDASNQGKIPSHIAHGVLSEDAIYNTLSDQHFIAVEYLKLITQIISNE